MTNPHLLPLPERARANRLAELAQAIALYKRHRTTYQRLLASGQQPGTARYHLSRAEHTLVNAARLAARAVLAS